MNPIQPPPFLPIDSSNLTDTAEPIATSRRRSAGSIHAAAASQSALVEIYKQLDQMKEEFDNFIDAGIEMADDLCALVSVKTDMGRIKAFDDSYNTVKLKFQDIELDLDEISVKLNRQKKDAQNVIAVGNCRDKLNEHLQFQQLMQDWKVVADCMADLKTSFVDQQLSAKRLKVIADFPQAMQQTPGIIEKKRGLEANIKSCLDKSCRAHRALLESVEIVFRKLGENAECEKIGTAPYKLGSDSQLQTCLELMNATATALVAAANSLHKYVRKSAQETIVSLYPVVTESGTTHPNHDENFKDLVDALRSKISGHGLYEKTIAVVESCKPLKELWTKSTDPESDLMTRHAIYEKFFEEGTTKIPQEKSDDFFRLAYTHQANLVKLQRANPNSTNQASGTDGAARAPIAQATIDAYYNDIQFAIGYIKAVIADGKVSEPALTDIKNRLGTMIQTSANQHSQTAEQSYYRLMTKNNELRGKTLIDPADAEQLAEMYLSFVRSFHSAALAVFDNVPKFGNETMIQDLAHKRSIVFGQMLGCWKCAAAFNEITIEHPELESQMRDPTSPLARAYGEIGMKLKEFEEKASPFMAFGDHFLCEQMFLQVNRYETNLNQLNLKAHAANPTRDFTKLIGKAIEHGTEEAKREACLLTAAKAKLQVLTEAQREGKPVDKSELDLFRGYCENYENGARRMQQRVHQWQVTAMLHDHPHLMKYFSMIRDQYNYFVPEILKLKARAPQAENVANVDAETVSDSDLQLLNDLSQLDSDIRLLNHKFKKKFDVQGSRRKAEFEPSFVGLKSLQSSVRSLLRDATDVIGINPGEQRQPVPGDHGATQTWEVDSTLVNDVLDSDAHEAEIGRLTASVQTAQLSSPSLSPAQLAKMMTEMNERSQLVEGMLSTATGWANFGRELAEDGGNPAHAKSFFTRAAKIEDQAVALLDINESLVNAHFKGKNTNGHKAAEIRARAENTRLEGDTIFTQLTKSKALPLDRDVKFVLDKNQISSIKISSKKSYTPRNPETGQNKVDHNNQPLIEWMKEIAITLKTDDGQEYPTWIVHVHYLNEHSADVKASHAKKYEDRKKGTWAGNVDRQYISQDNVKHLLRWEPTA